MESTNTKVQFNDVVEIISVSHPEQPTQLVESEQLKQLVEPEQQIESEQIETQEDNIKDFQADFYVILLNIFQQWYNNNIKPSYPSMIEDTDDTTYTNGSMETFYEFMSDFKDNINNLNMTRVYKLDDFIHNKHNEQYEEYFTLTIDHKTKIEYYASPLAFAIFIFLSKKDLKDTKWNIEIISSNKEDIEQHKDQYKEDNSDKDSDDNSDDNSDKDSDDED